MKINYLLFTLLLFNTLRCSDPKVLNYNLNLLKQKDGIHYRQKLFGEEVYSGKFFTTNSSGSVLGEGYIKNGKFHGSYKIDDGTIKELKTYNNGKLEKYSRYIYDEIIETGNYKNGEKDGEWYKFFRNSYGVEKLETYENGKLKGPSETYYKEPRKLKTEQIHPNGINKGYYKGYSFQSGNGQLQYEGYLKNSLKDGLYKYYINGTGNLQKEITFKEGYYHGVYKKYYNETNLDGEKILHYLYTYEYDVKHGLYERYNKYGIVLETKYYFETPNHKVIVNTKKEFKDLIVRDSLGTL